MTINKGMKIGIVIIAIVGIIVPIAAITIINMQDTSFVLEFSVDGTKVDQITLNQMKSEISAIQTDVDFLQVNGYNTREEYNCTGAPLWDIIDYLDINYGTANGIRLVSTDDFSSTFIPLNELQKEKDQFLVCWEINDTLSSTIEDPEEPGVLTFGHLFVACNFTVTQPKPCGNYNAKNLASINFVHYYNWNLTIFGDSILLENVTIPYGITNSSTSGMLYKTTNTFNYTDSSESWTDTFYGTPIGYLLNRTSGLAYSDSWDNWDLFRFVGLGGATSNWMTKADAMANPNLYMVAWRKGGVDLTYPGEGLFYGVCNYSVYKSLYPQGSDLFYMPNLIGIELALA